MGAIGGDDPMGRVRLGLRGVAMTNRVGRLLVGVVGLLRRESLLRQPGWIQSWVRNRVVDRFGEPLPWYTYPAVSFLEDRLRPDMSIFEYGSGNSTLWWSSHVSHVVSCEHDELWYRELVAQLPANVEYRLIPLSEEGNYAASASREPRTFDVVVIDGRERVACARASVSALAPGGIVVLDDSQRPRYFPALEDLAQRGFRRIDFRGPRSLEWRVTQTTVLYRPDNCIGI